MSPALMKMWVALASMGFMFISVISIYFSRFKFRNRFLKIIFSSIAYIFMILAGLIIFFVVLSGPVNE
ncbi:DUF2768 family protein [Bacillus lacus]|uniref:DUF2768 family protein n=1 Tax=Metabacillus lacus TaxID=1983721 RepID=A0A7X2IWG3_9BACI|nr:DUF2768 domain-containing protein [Metabacillus lacus]MRX71010.1 DUF2768 family protein [Metabacillus lacus]